MNNNDRTLMRDVLDRLERIEKAILGDPEHNMWGYKGRLEHLEDKQETLAIKIDTLEKHKARQTGVEFAGIIIASLVGAGLGSVITLIFSGG